MLLACKLRLDLVVANDVHDDSSKIKQVLLTFNLIVDGCIEKIWSILVMLILCVNVYFDCLFVL